MVSDQQAERIYTEVWMELAGAGEPEDNSLEQLVQFVAGLEVGIRIGLAEREAADALRATFEIVAARRNLTAGRAAAIRGAQRLAAIVRAVAG